MNEKNTSRKNGTKLVFLVLAGFVGGIVLGGISTTVVNSYNSGNASFWKFDPTFLHKDRVELSLEESARPDKQFIELLLPYEANLFAIAQKTATETQSDQVRNLANTVITTQEQIQIQIKQGDQGNNVEGVYALHRSDNVKGLEMLYKEWYAVDLAPSRLGLRLDQINTNSQLVQNAEDVDRENIRQMIHNEQIAVKLAYLVVDNAQSPAIRDLAQQIIQRQGSEITTLHDFLADLGSAPR
jgi:uncharacterized protein (DUF305 family)